MYRDLPRKATRSCRLQPVVNGAVLACRHRDCTIESGVSNLSSKLSGVLYRNKNIFRLCILIPIGLARSEETQVWIHFPFFFSILV